MISTLFYIVQSCVRTKKEFVLFREALPMKTEALASPGPAKFVILVQHRVCKSFLVYFPSPPFIEVLCAKTVKGSSMFLLYL